MAKLIIAATDHSLREIGNRLASLMNAANRYPDSARTDMGEEDHIDGILFTLNALGVPVKVRRNGEMDRYIGVELAGRTFYVTGNEKEATPNG